VARLGGRLGLIDEPKARSSHAVPTPKGGGIGILAAFALVALVAGVPWAIWAPAAGVSLLGLATDRRDLPPKLRLVLQFACAGLVVVFAARVEWSLLQIALAPFWAVFIVGTANYYNFMDGINGIAGITGLVAFGLLWFAIAATRAADPDGRLAAALGAACAGFLPLNLPRARVFMGDVGAMLLGFCFASLVRLHAATLEDFVMLVAFLFPFYTDELLTLIVRLRDRDPLTVAHRRHIYQLLANQLGIAHWKVSAGYGIVNLAVGVAALALRGHGLTALLGLLVGCFALAGALGHWLRSRVEVMAP
jgi:Fuc2NAc and GlcNAc transferase